jgi:glycosyltransferase involved in cell wall biosynthesis
MAETVRSLDCDITIIGRRRGNCCRTESVPFRTRRFRMIFKRGFCFYMFFNIRLFFYLLFHRYDCLVSNDLDTLLPNYLVSGLLRHQLVFDSHEYFTGVPEVQNRHFVKWVWKSIEKKIFPHLHNIITVSESIAALYEEEYSIRPVVVRNLGKNADHIISFPRVELGVPSGNILLIIQGTGINIDKGAEELIEAVNNFDGVSLLVVGSGDVIPVLKQTTEKLDLGNKVIFIPAVNWETLMRYTKSADIGMVLEKGTNINYLYSLPNKLFDYISAGIPVIASDLPETGKILREFGCGISIADVSPENITCALSELKNNPPKLQEMRRSSVAAAEKLNWEAESKKVLEFYKKVISDIGS